MTDQPLVERPTNDPSSFFKEMAQAIEHNRNQGFGGAVVIVPPTGGGDNIELLILDSKADIAQFWSTIKTRIDIRLADLDQKARGPFGGR